MDFVDQLKDSVDIVRVVGEHVRLRKAGTTYKGLCPFHNEKTPSFVVNPQRQAFKCFGCGAGGDLLEFVMKVERVSFYEALKLLADRNGIPMPKRSEYTDEDSKLRGAIYRMHEIAASEFRSQLQDAAGQEARTYLLQRGVSAETAARFDLGYAPRGGMLRLLASHNFTNEQMEKSGLVRRREDGSFYEMFRNRLMFPIHNETGKPIGFGGRALDPNDQPKYLNTPETPIYRKSTVLYNLHRAKDPIRQRDRAVLVEGYMDAVGVDAAGVQEAIASCGTALTTQQVASIKRHSTNLAVSFDPDAAGGNAAEKSIQMLLDAGIQIRIVELEGGLDPHDFCRKHGAEAYQRKVSGAKNYFYWMADRARARFDTRSAQGRVAALQFLLPAIQGLSDRLERAAVAADIAAYLGVPGDMVLDHFRKMAADRRSEPVQPQRETVPALDRALLGWLLSSCEAREEFLPEVRTMVMIRRSPAQRIYEGLFALADSREPVDFNRLHARLEEHDRDLLCDALLRDDPGSGEVSHEEGIRCVEALRLAERKLEQSDLSAQIRAAEHGGDLAEALRLAAVLKGRTTTIVRKKADRESSS